VLTPVVLIVPGMIGALCNNNLGICGVSPVVKLMGCKFLDSKGNGYTSDAVKCLDYALQMGVDITLNSYGGLNADSDALKVKPKLQGSFVTTLGFLLHQCSDKQQSAGVLTFTFAACGCLFASPWIPII
jgi:hypothetical protein